MVEQGPFKPKVVGSTPTRPMDGKSKRHTPMQSVALFHFRQAARLFNSVSCSVQAPARVQATSFAQSPTRESSVEQIHERFADGHRAYVAHYNNEPAAFGWVATHKATIGELNTSYNIPAGQRYLWNFVTLPAHRGKGIYPRLLEAIMQSESREASLFWIAYAPENHASAAGIHKSGFTTVAQLSFDGAERPAVTGLTRDGGKAATDFLGIPQTETELSKCWRCARARNGEPCSERACRCDYQRPLQSCSSN